MPVRHRRSNRRRLVRPNNQITRALAPPSLPRPPSPTPHDLTPKLRATFPSFVTRYRAGERPITSRAETEKKYSARGPRARNNISIATPSPPPGRARRRAATGEQLSCSPVAFNDIKHLTRSMPADGLEAQDVVPPRCGCWVAHEPAIPT